MNYSSGIRNLFVLICAVFLLCYYSGSAMGQSKTITVIFGSGEEVQVSNWSFVYHLSEKSRIIDKKKIVYIMEKESRNLHLRERYDKKEGETDFWKGKDINIEPGELSSIEYLWNWEHGNTKGIIIVLKDGTKIKRLRLGPFSETVLAAGKPLYAEAVYLTGFYKLNEESKFLEYNLNKWIQGELPKKEIIAKIVFQ
jgi:hypothetical protein